MNVIGISGLHQSVSYKKRLYPDLTAREYRIAQGYDSAGALVTDDGVIAAVAEERFTREKTTGRFPTQAIQYCLQSGKISEQDVDFVAHSFDYTPFKGHFSNGDPDKDQYAEVF